MGFLRVSCEVHISYCYTQGTVWLMLIRLDFTSAQWSSTLLTSLYIYLEKKPIFHASASSQIEV